MHFRKIKKKYNYHSEKIKWIGIFLIFFIILVIYTHFLEILSYSQRFVIFSFLNSILFFLFLKTKFTKKIYKFLINTKKEIKNIIWSDKKKSFITTIIIIISIIFISCILWILDNILFKFISWIIKLRL